MIVFTLIRGDERSRRIRIWTKNESGLKVPYDFTGYTDLKLTANPEEEPANDTNQLFQSDMTIVAPATSGWLEFSVDTAQWTSMASISPGVYYFSINGSDPSSNNAPILISKWRLAESIRKS